MLDKLPTEVVLLIAEHFRERLDLVHWSQVSKRFHVLLTPIVWRSITLSSDEWDISNLKTEPILRYSAHHLRLVKSLEIVAPFHRRLRTRCSIEDDIEDEAFIYDSDGHLFFRPGESDAENDVSEDFGSEDDDPEENDLRVGDDLFENSDPLASHVGLMTALESRLVPIIGLIPVGELQTFSWKLGVCVPTKVIERLSTRQPQLLSLSILSDTSCLRQHYLPLDGLERFEGLRSVHFVPARAGHDIQIGEILLRNAHSLEKIAFHRQDSMRECNTRERANGENFFAHYMLNVSPQFGIQTPLFPALRSLELSFVSFENGIEDMISIFNFPQLTSLKLRNCFRMNGLFTSLSRPSRSIQLSCFEINCTGPYVEQIELKPLLQFLKSFSGLRDLFVLCQPLREYGKDFWLSIEQHRPTLRRFVYQQAAIFNDCSDPRPGILWEFESLDFTSIGCTPQELQASLKNAHPRPKLKFLHVRQTGLFRNETQLKTTERNDVKFSNALPSMIEFAKWVFGPDGLPQLQILAFGDFAFAGRQPNIAWGRLESMPEGNNPQNGDLPFREITKTDAWLWGRLQENLDFLEACPEDQLLHHFPLGFEGN